MFTKENIKLFILDKVFDLLLSGGSGGTTFKTVREGIPDMNIAYVWLICWAVGLATYILLPLRKRFKGDKKIKEEELLKPLKQIIDKTFKNQKVKLDGKNFINCTFTNCTLEYWDENFGMQGCNINKSRPSFRTTATQQTFQLLYQMGYIKEEFKPIIKDANEEDN